MVEDTDPSVMVSPASNEDPATEKIDKDQIKKKSSVQTVSSTGSSVDANGNKRRVPRKISKRGVIAELRNDSCFTNVALAAWFDNLALIVIVLNALWIGVEVDANDGDGDQTVFDVVEHIFCTLFTLEILIRLFSYKKIKFFFTDQELYFWNIFDLFLVLLMVVENWILRWVIADEEGAMSSLSALRLLRLLRISRIFRMVPELGMMVKSMAAAARSVSSTMVLAVGLMYVFAIVFTQWGKNQKSFNGTEIDEETGERKTNYWGSLGYSFLSLMQILVYDDTFALIRDTYETNNLMGLLLIVFIIVGAFTVLNMLIGVICEIVSTTKKEEEEKLLMNKVEDLFAQMDADSSGTISREEFEAKTDLLERLGLDQSTIRLAFELIDDDKSGSLEMQEFVHMVFRLLHPPSSQDLLVIKRNLARLCDSLGCDVFDAPPPMKQKKSKKSVDSEDKDAKKYYKKSLSRLGSGGDAHASENAVAQYSIENVESAIKDAVQQAIQVEMKNIPQNPSAPSFANGADDSNLNSVICNLNSSGQQISAEQIMSSLQRIETVITNLRDKLQVKRKSSSALGSALNDANKA